jgi:hypothetical protein
MVRLQRAPALWPRAGELVKRGLLLSEPSPEASKFKVANRNGFAHHNKSFSAVSLHPNSSSAMKGSGFWPADTTFQSEIIFNLEKSS